MGRNLVEKAKQLSWGDEKNVKLADSSSTTSVALGDQKEKQGGNLLIGSVVTF